MLNRSIYLILIFFFVIINAHAQHAKIINDTAFYNQYKFTTGDTVHLGYGSTPDKSFAFVYSGSAIGVEKAAANLSKSDCIIDKVYKTQGTVYIRCKIIGSGKVFIDVEGAIDNKEIIPGAP